MRNFIDGYRTDLEDYDYCGDDYNESTVDAGIIKQQMEYDAWKAAGSRELYLGYNNEFGVGSVQFNNETGEEQYGSHIVYGPFANMEELQEFADEKNIEFGIPTQLYKDLEHEAAYEADIIEQMRRG